MIVPVSAKLPYAQTELQLPRQAKVLGVVDLEIRATSSLEPPVVPAELSKHWIPGPLVRELRLGNLLRNERTRLNLSLRDVSSTSRRIADLLGDDRYFISQSSLSDYEALDSPPRHFHKAMSLCILYGLQFRDFLETIGMDPADAGIESMPDYFLSRHSLPAFPEVAGGAPLDPGGFLGELLKECQEIPIFLRNALRQFSGLPRVSLNDLFWIGGEATALNPYLVNGLFVLVNRRKRKPMYFGSKPIWQQPIYVILKRDGTYLCACCGIENGTLIVHPYSREFYRPIQLRYHHDAEIVGQVVAIARKLS